MIDHFELQTALRTRLLTLSVATCSGVDLSASGAVFTRASGSFLTDGFSPGMEVTGAGFSNAANNDDFTVTGVTATTLTVSGSLTTEAAGSGKTLTVGLPAGRAWENIEYTPVTGAPWIEEQLVPAGTRQISAGAGGTLETRVLYQVQVHVPEDQGIGAPNRYADTVLTLFTPRTQITFDTDKTARVRTDTGPYRGQLLRRRQGFATVPVAIPLEIWTANTI